VYFTILQIRHSKPIKTMNALKKLVCDPELSERTQLWVVESTMVNGDRIVSRNSDIRRSEDELSL